MKTLFLVIALALMVNQGFAVCATANTAPAGKCCAPASGAAIKATGVDTCATGTDADVAATACLAGYYLATDTCTICPTGKYCTGGTAAGTTCEAGYTCATTGLAAAVPCGQDTYSAAGSTAATCAAITGTASAGCVAYKEVGATNCAIAATGFVAIVAGTPVPATTQAGNACAAGCAACTAKADDTKCTTPMDGWVLDTTTTAGTSKLVACSADKSCGKCTWDATAKKAVCSAAGAGFQWDSTASTGTRCELGKGNAAANTSATCTDCTTGQNCRSCLDVGFCDTCLPGYVLDAAKGTCTKFGGTPHGSCKVAQGSNPSQCNTCDSALNRVMPIDATTSSTALVGSCGCAAGYADYTVASSANFACMACGSPASNYATCTFSSTGAITAVTCNSASTIGKAGMTCAALAASTAPAGFFFNSASNTFAACGANCNACTTASVCTACADLASTFVYPTASSDTKFGTYLTAPKRALWNGVCSDNCPTGTTANSDKSNCTNSTAAGGAGSGAASGVFAVFALIASLFIVF